MTLALHVITMNRDDELMRLLAACKSYVDVMRVCDGGDNVSTLNVCKNFGAEYYIRQWDDDYSAQDNLLLNQAQYGDWILVQDDDEVPTLPLLENLRELINTTEFDMIRIPSLDIVDGAMMCSISEYLRRNDEGEFDKRFRKDWLFRNHEGVFMQGSPHRSPVKTTGDWSRHDTGYPYLHIKASDSSILNDCIHAFINPEQQQYSESEARDLHKLCSKAKLDISRNVEPFLKYGHPSDSFRNWMWEHADDNKPIAAWFAARYFLYRPDELDRYDFQKILDSGALLRLAELKSCYVVSNIRTIHIHPLLKQRLMQYGIFHTDDIRERHGLRAGVHEELPTEKEIDMEPVIMMEDTIGFQPNPNIKPVVITDVRFGIKKEMPIEMPEKEYRDDIQDNPEYWNQDDVVNNDTAKEFDVVEEASNHHGHLEFLKEYELPADIRILEVGCGGGRILAQWSGIHAGYNLRLAGLDHSSKVIDLAFQRLPGVTFFTGTLDDLIGIDPGHFDIIYTHTCLQHNSADKQDSMFDAIYKLLMDDGLLYLINEMTFSQHDWPQHVVDEKMEPWFSDSRGSAGTAAWWIARIVDHGFELLEYKNSRYVFRKIARG